MSVRPRAAVPALLLVLAAWSLFAFAGSYRWTSVPVVAGAALAAALARPRPGGRHRYLDLALVVCLLVVAAQLVPLPPSLRLGLAPESAALDAELFLGRRATATGAAYPLSTDPDSTGWALLFAAAVLVLFWSARATLERSGGVRRLCRGVAGLGFLLACLVFVQRALSPRRFYGLWLPTDLTPDPRPLGPFINRNMLATWLVLAIPLVAGYLLARLDARRTARAAGIGADVLDARMVWIAASLCLMLATLLASLSRSGLAGAAAAGLVLLLLARRHLRATQVAGLAGGLVGLGLIAALYANVPALADRFGDVYASGLGGRVEVWRQTWPMVAAFPLTGIGVGAFERGMSVYQTSNRTLFVNHAHNEYLQVLVEGGLLLAVPLWIAIGIAAWRVARRLRTDRTSVFWIRAGAAAALAGVAVQSVWDIGLRQPANAVLFAAVAAIALHRPRDP
jgi:O-antigen ligase